MSKMIFRGKPMSAETKAKISAKAKARFRDNPALRDERSKHQSKRLKRIHAAARESKMKIDLEDVEMLDLSSSTVRAFISDPNSIAEEVSKFVNELENLLDKAQGNIKTGQTTEVLIVLRVRA